MRYLITQSLLSAWTYIFHAYDAEQANEDFLRSLRREPSEDSEAKRSGRIFESLCYAFADGRSQEHPWASGAKDIGDIIKGGARQVTCSAALSVKGEDFLVYGIMDVLKSGIIYDIKFSTKSFGSIDLAGHYLDSPQHPTYFYLAPSAYEFKYLVSDGEDVYIEPYRREQTRPLETIMSQFIDYLKVTDLWETYKQYWRATND